MFSLYPEAFTIVARADAGVKHFDEPTTGSTSESVGMLGLLFRLSAISTLTGVFL